MKLCVYFCLCNLTDVIGSFIKWCNDHHLKLNVSRTNELMVDYNTSNVDVAGHKLKSGGVK